MANYNDSYENPRNLQRDLVLASNEFCFLQSKTNGIIKTYTGPITMTISAQEALVIFDSKSKQFIETTDFSRAKQLFVSAPENWYVVLKNPAHKNEHPETGKAIVSPELEIGRKININGPTSFSLFPGQMAKVVQGHRLRSNQYLLARVYDAEAAAQSAATIVQTDGKQTTENSSYFSGQLLVIKGTEVSFYIPPTGIEVIPVDNDPRKGYVRNAITLERLEYAILKDENGTKTYVHGPRVVFPAPTETFVTSPNNTYVFRAIELSPISGIYAKVIAEYKDEKGVVHPVGEELFITGKDQMIYYPRPEHAIINYDNKIMHHAIAIPKGEGRYILNRLTGDIKTVKGPAMYLPDPRTEVVVKRKLTVSQCELWFPGNYEALAYNQQLNEKAVEKSLKQVNLDSTTAYACSFSDSATMANLEAKANISRNTSYTKPRTITLDNKYEGVVTMDIWTGCAVNLISKDGTRKVVCGPQTILLDYDQTLDVLQLSTGTPKNPDKLLKTVFLRYENNKISDLVSIETSDHVKGSVKVCYNVNFDKEKQDSWYSVDNYIKLLCDHTRTLIKRAAKEHTVESLYQNYHEIIRSAVLKNGSLHFAENGMSVYECEVIELSVESEVAKMLNNHKMEMVGKSLELRDAARRVELATALADAEQKEQELRSQQLLNKMELQRTEAVRKQEVQAEVNRLKEAEIQAARQAELDLQGVMNAISDAENARENATHSAEMERKAARYAAEEDHAQHLAEIEEARNKSYAATVAKIMESISPELVAALQSQSNADIVNALSHAVGPYAIAQGDESIADVTSKLLRGTGFEDLVKHFGNNQ